MPGPPFWLSGIATPWSSKASKKTFSFKGPRSSRRRPARSRSRWMPNALEQHDQSEFSEAQSPSEGPPAVAIVRVGHGVIHEAVLAVRDHLHYVSAKALKEGGKRGFGLSFQRLLAFSSWLRLEAALPEALLEHRGRSTLLPARAILEEVPRVTTQQTAHRSTTWPFAPCLWPGPFYLGHSCSCLAEGTVRRSSECNSLALLLQQVCLLSRRRPRARGSSRPGSRPGACRTGHRAHHRMPQLDPRPSLANPSKGPHSSRRRHSRRSPHPRRRHCRRLARHLGGHLPQLPTRWADHGAGRW